MRSLAEADAVPAASWGLVETVSVVGVIVAGEVPPLGVSV